MSASIPNLAGTNLEKYLKIVSRGAIYNNLSEDSIMWDKIKVKKKGDTEGREQRFALRSSYGAGAVGFVPISGGAYPMAQKSTLVEGLSIYKDFALTVEVDRTVIAKAISDMSKYGEPLAEELRTKTIELSRQLSISLYGDGTGIMGTVSSAALSSGKVVITLQSANTSLGTVNWFSYGDLVTIYNNTGTSAHAPTTVSSGTFGYFSVADKDRDNNTVTLQAINTLNTAVDVTVLGAAIISGDVIYRKIQTDNQDVSGYSLPDVSAAITDDYNTQSFNWPGLESLSQNDGRKVNNITLSGALAGTRKDAGGVSIDSSHFQNLMSSLMIKVGQGRYTYKNAIMSYEALDALVESRETDRRFQSIQDDKRGVASLGYVAGKNTLVFESDEFCPKNRIYAIPEGDVLQFYGSDFDFVKPDGGSKFHLKPNGSGYNRSIQAFMEGQGCLQSVHSAAIGVIHNFTV